MQMPDPRFPPLLHGEGVNPPLGAFKTACEKAEAGECGAGDIIWSRNIEAVDLAIILEPDVDLAQTQQMVPLTMVALGDALGVLCPPKVAIQFRWPAALMINGAQAGEFKLAVQDCRSSDVPRWAVVGVSLALAHNDKTGEPGEARGQTCLAEEGGGELTRSQVIQSFAAHWMTAMHNWQEDGCRALYDQWLFRAVGADSPAIVSYLGRDFGGAVVGLDDAAGLKIVSADGRHSVLKFAPFVYRWNKDMDLVNGQNSGSGAL